MRTYLSFFLGLCITIAAFSSCKKNDSGPDNTNPPQAPTNIILQSLNINNVNDANFPAGNTLYNYEVDVYSGNVLVGKTSRVSKGQLPYSTGFEGVNYFSYNMKEYDLKFYGLDINDARYPLGTVRLALRDYSSDTYPQPSAMFFNTNGFAGTLYLSYQ